MSTETKKNHYVVNKDFLAAIIERKKIVDAMAEGEEKPVLSNYLAKCIFDICNHLSYKPNFIGYSYRQEMIGDALENCLRVVDNFDPEKSSNPFAYFTQIAYFAFLRRIETEKKQSYIRGKLLDELPLDELMDLEDFDGQPLDFVEQMRQNYYYDTAEYEAKKEKKKAEKDAKLEAFMNAEE
jgi:hypothetical protein